MSNIDTIPNMYIDGETYVSCNHDWSDLEEKIDFVLSNYNELNQKIIHNARTKCAELYNTKNLCFYIYDLIKNLKGVEEE
jgi:glycosyltransferase involved in cell wall biosynthesis